MSNSTTNSEPESAKPAAAQRGHYVVVARRYRPQTFEDLVGQGHVGKALAGAINSDRVGHAYLFTGARGVGKTSAARIFAKALNCEKGPGPVPCNQCDICDAISSGEDVDVLEIDGASNRGIDEIRQLRQNAGVRPSRARSKIYIIDEVHMLTREAFNALLKTLEEPPGHVKFIFCTTEPSKIPITILSRCQRFDFAGILWHSIAERLKKIAENEGAEADPEALQVIARRAAGSMRDGESLLEQLLSFASDRITVADVHQMLGSAGEERLATMVGHLVDRNSAAAMVELDLALHEGVDPGLLLEQLFGYFRDCMAALVGCPGETFLHASPGSHEEVAEMGKRFGLETLMAAMQVLDQTLSRLRYSTQGRILAELALVRIANLADLDELSSLIAQLQEMPSGGADPRAAAPSSPAQRPRVPTPPPVRQTPANPQPTSSPAAVEPESQAPPEASDGGGSGSLMRENAAELWKRILEKVPGMASEHAKHYDRIAISAPNTLAVHFKPGYNFAKSVCEQPDQLAKFEKALADATGQRVRLEFSVGEEEPDEAEIASPARTISPQQRIAEITKHPMIHRAGELFDAHPIRVDDPPEEKK